MSAVATRDPIDALVPQVERVYRALAHLHFADADRDTGKLVRYDTATGFLVRLGGRAFVFTAKHNLQKNEFEEETVRSTGVAFPRELTIPVHIGEGVRRFFRAGSDVDAAVIELDPSQTVLWQSSEPFERRELGTLTEPRSGDVLCLCGFPTAETQERPGVPGMELQYEHLATMVLVSDLPGRRSTYEPSEGRGIHVRYEGRSFDYKLKRWQEIAHPRGMSGGPLVAIGGGCVRVLGIARSIENGAEWCEPVVECARLLVQHEDPAFADEARAVVIGQ